MIPVTARLCDMALRVTDSAQKVALKIALKNNVDPKGSIRNLLTDVDRFLLRRDTASYVCKVCCDFERKYSSVKNVTESMFRDFVSCMTDVVVYMSWSNPRGGVKPCS